MDPYDQLPGQDPVTVSGRVTTAKTKRYLVVAGVLAGGVTLGALFSPIGLAGAQEGGSGTAAAEGGGSTPSTQANGDTTPGTDASGPSTDKPADGADKGGKGDHHGRGGHHGFWSASDELATVLGLSSEDLWGQLAEGKSLGEIADAQGVSRDTVVDTLTKGMADHLADEVAEGDLTQSEADSRLAEAKDFVAGMIDKGRGDWAGGWGKGGGMGWGMGHDHGHGGMGLGRGADLQGLADSLGIDLDQLRTDVMGGKTVAEAAAAQGVSADDLKAALKAEAAEHIDRALADGRIDQAKADELKADLDTRIDDLINGKAGDLGGHGWGGGGMGRGGWGGGHHGNGNGDGQSGSGGGETQPSSFQA